MSVDILYIQNQEVLRQPLPATSLLKTTVLYTEARDKGREQRRVT